MSTSRTRVSADTYVRKARPSTNYIRSRRLEVNGLDAVTYVYFSRPFPLGATIISAKLIVTSWAFNEPVDHTLTVRLIDEGPPGERLRLSRTTWNNRPDSLLSGEASVTKTGPLPTETEWEFDVSQLMQSVADGTPWWGFRIISPDNMQHFLVSGNVYQTGPVLEVEWSDAPDIPENLVPADNQIVSTSKPTLRFDYVDVSGDQQLESVQVQINDTDEWTTPAFDSGIVDTGVPELDLEKTLYAGLLNSGPSAWWRVRVKDGAGLWSEWSDAAQMRYVERSGLTVVSPVAGDFFDPTQTVSWVFDGTQERYRVEVYHASNTKTPIWTTGITTGTDTSVTVPAGVIRKVTRNYLFKIHVWDDLDRVSTPGAVTFAARRIETTYRVDENQPGVMTTTAETMEPTPKVTVRWTYDQSLPDAWLVFRNGEIVKTIESNELFPVNGVYTYEDNTAQPYQSNGYIVRPLVNGRTHWGNNIVYVTPKPFGIWLMNDEEEVVLMGQESGDFEMGENSTVHEVLGSSKVTLVTQGLRGYESSIDGQFVSGVPGVSKSAQQMRDQMWQFKEQAAKGESFRLAVSDMNIPVTIANISVSPRPDSEIMFDVSFDFWQNGELPFDAS